MDDLWCLACQRQVEFTDDDREIVKCQCGSESFSTTPPVTSSTAPDVAMRFWCKGCRQRVEVTVHPGESFTLTCKCNETSFSSKDPGPIEHAPGVVVKVPGRYAELLNDEDVLVTWPFVLTRDDVRYLKSMRMWG